MGRKSQIIKTLAYGPTNPWTNPFSTDRPPHRGRHGLAGWAVVVQEVHVRHHLRVAPGAHPWVGDKRGSFGANAQHIIFSDTLTAVETYTTPTHKRYSPH